MHRSCWLDVFHRLVQVPTLDDGPVDDGAHARELDIETFRELTERGAGAAQLSILFLQVFHR